MKREEPGRVPLLLAPAKAGGVALAGRASCADSARFLFSKRNRGKKRRRGELLVPLSTPLQKGGLLGAAPFLPQYNAFRIGGKPGIGHARLRKYRRSGMNAGERFGGVQRGVSPLWAFFPTAFFAKKAVLPPSRQPARQAQTPPAFAGKRGSLSGSSLFICPLFCYNSAKQTHPKSEE